MSDKEIYTLWLWLVFRVAWVRPGNAPWDRLYSRDEFERFCREDL